MKMFIEVWSDIACPFCYIGKRNLENALKELAEDVPVVWRSFELDPNAPKTAAADNATRLAEKYGKSLEWAKDMNAQVAARAQSIGLHLELDRVVATNTFDAHRLVHLAETRQRHGAMKERLFAAYFTEGKNLSDRPTLVSLAAEIGLDPHEVASMLDSDRFGEDVRSDERLAKDLEISGVPFFVVNQRFAISGAQPKDYFVETLKTLKIELDKDEE